MNQSQSTSPKVSTTHNTMAGIDNTLRMPKLQGAGSKDPKHHLFVCVDVLVAMRGIPS
jgi:hypothetical protein